MSDAPFCLLSGGESSIVHVLRQYPVLLRLCVTIDMYQPWSRDTYIAVAKQWLLGSHRYDHIPLPWSENKDAQVMLIANAMAYIHSSSMRAVEKLQSHRKRTLQLFTPITFKEFVHVFKVIANHIQAKEKVSRHTRHLSCGALFFFP